MTKKPLLLAIDTATRFAGLAIYDGEFVLAESWWLSQNNHSVELMPALVRMLDRQNIAAGDLSAVAVAIGPGSFTGLRIGLSVAKGLAVANNIALLGVPTLDIYTVVGSRHVVYNMPLPQTPPQPVLPGIDRMLNFYPTEQRRPLLAVIQAGRKRLCAARYEYRGGQWKQRGALQLTNLEGLSRLISSRILVCGELSKEEIAYLSRRVETDVAFATPSQAIRHPACLAELAWQRLERGEQSDLATLSPIYLKSPQT